MPSITSHRPEVRDRDACGTVHSSHRRDDAASGIVSEGNAWSNAIGGTSRWLEFNVVSQPRNQRGLVRSVCIAVGTVCFYALGSVGTALAMERSLTTTSSHALAPSNFAVHVDKPTTADVSANAFGSRGQRHGRRSHRLGFVLPQPTLDQRADAATYRRSLVNQDRSTRRKNQSAAMTSRVNSFGWHLTNMPQGRGIACFEVFNARTGQRVAYIQTFERLDKVLASVIPTLKQGECSYTLLQHAVNECGLSCLSVRTLITPATQSPDAATTLAKCYAADLTRNPGVVMANNLPLVNRSQVAAFDRCVDQGVDPFNTVINPKQSAPMALQIDGKPFRDHRDCARDLKLHPNAVIARTYSSRPEYAGWSNRCQVGTQFAEDLIHRRPHYVVDGQGNATYQINGRTAEIDRLTHSIETKFAAVIDHAYLHTPEEIRELRRGLFRDLKLYRLHRSDASALLRANPAGDPNTTRYEISNEFDRTLLMRMAERGDRFKENEDFFK